jgi:hypothetical protein
MPLLYLYNNTAPSVQFVPSFPTTTLNLLNSLHNFKDLIGLWIEAKGKVITWYGPASDM